MVQNVHTQERPLMAKTIAQATLAQKLHVRRVSMKIQSGLISILVGPSVPEFFQFPRDRAELSWHQQTIIDTLGPEHLDIVSVKGQFWTAVEIHPVVSGMRPVNVAKLRLTLHSTAIVVLLEKTRIQDGQHVLTTNVVEGMF